MFLEASLVVEIEVLNMPPKAMNIISGIKTVPTNILGSRRSSLTSFMKMFSKELGKVAHLQEDFF
jgi:hypothetical protein